ncbi:hypothetical protein GCM10025867_10590 [Frondihabitans sucicola]|uniref:Dihydropteroate synthase n=1 Tax=Frondihabitans sucicola TaxID=1268041 RepID=A0ABN6XZJ9_9MICO|nr:hypothetical protein GCM10025867_10590 [Frondihabitans sucicola]
MRPRPSVEGAEQQLVPSQTEAPGRRLIAGGVFDKPLAAGTSVETASRSDPTVARHDPAPPVGELDDVATRAIAVVRQAGPGPEGTEPATPFVPARTLVMGILNVTLDSFSDGGRYAQFDDAIAHARLLASDGADIIDVGGESTRPGAPRVDVHEEQRRVIPVIRELVDLGLRVSVDTMNAATAYAAREAGADVINDVSGGLADHNMAQVVADTDATYIAMHWRGHSDVMTQRATYGDAVAEVKAELFRRVAELVVQECTPTASSSIRDSDSRSLPTTTGSSSGTSTNWPSSGCRFSSPPRASASWADSCPKRRACASAIPPPPSSRP